jgi:hypothetical protein
MAQATPDPSCIVIETCGTEVKTSLDGYHLPASSDPATEDTAACEALTVTDYIDRGLILAQVNDQWNVLGLCGNTGLGTYYYGCLSGGATASLFVQGDEDSAGACDFVATGEEVTAQICKSQCDSLIPFSIGDHSSIVLIAKIGTQWFIVNVLDRGFVTNIPDFKTPICDDACCGIGVKEIEVTIGAGCGALSGEVFRLTGPGNWTGSVTVGADTFAMTITCTIGEAGASDWAITGGCAAQVGADSFNVVCADPITGDADFSNISCSPCSSVSVTFTSVGTEARACDTIVYTGDEVTMEACGIPALEVGDQVIMANVPKVGSSCTGTGTGTSAAQWQMIQACNDTLNCGAPCPPPPPPFDAACCDWNSIQIPETLVGILTLDSDDSNCVCSAAVTFELDPNPLVEGSPPVWEMTGNVCSGSTGTGTSGNALLGVGSLAITCGGQTGTGTGTGTGGLQNSFSLDSPTTPFLEGAVGSCDPLVITWEDIPTGLAHCDGGTLPPSYVRLSLEVTEA